MTTQPYRLPAAHTPHARVDRSTPIAFAFDGREYQGYAGDTLASALLANGVSTVARSFKYHRRRGIVAAGVEEPNALVQLRQGAHTEPNTPATTQSLFAGLQAAPQNCWPSLGFDIGAINGALSRMIPAGFYYKTFMWPASPQAWLRYERTIRAAAGLGRTPEEADPDRYEKMHAHCDVLVVGAGPAGLAAALAAARAGARVIIADEGSEFGGALLGDPAGIDGIVASQWIAAASAELAGISAVIRLPRTTAFGYYDQNLLGLLEQVTDHLAQPPAHLPRQRYWQVRARRVVLATGAHERPLVFANNDLPGVMLAGAARTYAQRYAVAPGERCVLFANNDDAVAAALALADCGVSIAAIVDSRPDSAVPAARTLAARGIEVLFQHAVVAARGRRRVRAVDVAPLAPDGAIAGASRRIACDTLLMSGGFNPVVHLFSQTPGTLRFDEPLGAFVPERSPQAVRVAGAANGTLALDACLREGFAAGREAASAAGFDADPGAPPRARDEPAGRAPAVSPLWSVPAPSPAAGKRFVDFHNDVTAEDVALAQRENYASVEHMKRYTTLGMGSDQGKMSAVNGLALLAAHRGVPIPQVGTTTFRPPYVPVTLGALIGPERGEHVEPTRFTPMHAWHESHGARFVNAGLWKRAQMYPRQGESELDCANREALAVRAGVGLVDVSTLGKIELSGRDAAAFLDRVYTGRLDNLAIGRCRYALMLREDGFVFDDGTVSRLGERHYLLTTTTANAARVMQHLEFCAQVLWPELQVWMSSVTEQWAAAALAGPRCRQVLAPLTERDVSNAALPFLAASDCRVAGIPARLSRISYSGELAYEIHVPSDYGTAMWEAVLDAGRGAGIVAYGTEAMGILRIEKGHVVVGPEADGRTTADDLGLGKMVHPDKDCIGKRAAQRPALRAADRWQLVGLTSLEGGRDIPRGAKLVASSTARPPTAMLGHVSSTCFSPHLGASIALALLARGRERHGEELFAASPLAGTTVKVRVGPPCFIDPEGARLRG